MKSWQFAQAIINWQHISGRNNLPWQIKKNAYYTWISEIMLQQTQLTTVIPYFKKFIHTFHDILSITKTCLNHIFYLWSGLGYYKRAKNIYQTAHIVVSQYNGKLPKNLNLLMQLPGIGRTTAGAILSLTYNFSFPILDANVKRVLTRFYNICLNNKKSIIEKKLWNKINILTPIHNANKFNQGMMDLGALICKNKKPKCILCPIQTSCKYQYNNNHVTNIIYKKKNSFFIILQYKNKILLEHRIENTIWNYLFCFPEFQSIQAMEIWLLKNNIYTKSYYQYNNFSYKFSNLVVKMIIVKSTLKNKIPIINKKKYIWYNLNTEKKIGIPAPIKKIILTLNIIK